MFKLLKKKWFRISSAAIALAITATLVFNLLFPVEIKPKIGYLSFGVSVAEAASITTLEGHSGFEFNDFTEWDTVVGSPSVQGTIKNTGGYAMRTNPSAALAYVVNDFGQSYTGLRATVYLRIATAPDTEIAIIGDTASANEVNVRLTTDRYLKLYNYTTQKGSTGSTQLSLDTWYRISVSLDADTANDPAKVYINGNEEISADTDGATKFVPLIGVITSATADIYFDDFAKDSTSSTADLGDVRVLRSMPVGNGNANEYDTQSGYTYVDDFPISDASFVEDAGSDTARELFTLEETTALGIGASDDIHAINIWIRGDRDGGGGTDHMTTVRDSSTNYNSADHNFDGIAWFDWYTPDLPNGGGAWTVARFNALEVGAYHSGAQDQRVRSALVMVAYTPTGASPDFTNSPSTIAFGTVATSAQLWSNGSAPTFPLDDGECYFTITSTSAAAIDIDVKATNFTGGVGWTLASTPGSNIVTLKVGKSGDANEAAMVVLTTTDQSFITSLAASGTIKWELHMETPTAHTDGALKTSTITLTASLS